MRVVVKIGTSTITHDSGQLNIRRMELLCKTLADLQNAGHQVLVVSSAAIAMGVGKLRLKERPVDIPSRQAAAAVGQCELMHIYDQRFIHYGHVVAQILLTAEDIHSETRRNNLEATLFRLLELGSIPILNENDSVATAELEGGVIGDNDTLSAEVAILAKADLLVMLTDIEGLYTEDPRKDKEAYLIERVKTITDELMESAGGGGSQFSTGGMLTKLKAAKMLEKEGINLVITNGKNPECLYKIMEGKPCGTYFAFEKERDGA